MEPKDNPPSSYQALEDRYLSLHAPSQRSSALLDLQSITAAVIYSIKLSEVTSKQRMSAKVVNYHLLYTPNARWTPPARADLLAIYSPEQIVDLQILTKWDGSCDFYAHLVAHFQKMYG